MITPIIIYCTSGSCGLMCPMTRVAQSLARAKDAKSWVCLRREISVVPLMTGFRGSSRSSVSVPRARRLDCALARGVSDAFGEFEAPKSRPEKLSRAVDVLLEILPAV